MAVIESATNLEELADGLDEVTPHAAYFRAKEIWASAKRAEQATRAEPPGLPGTTVAVAGTPFHVHGITHADTTAERKELHTAIDRWSAEAGIYCEQGIRSLYFQDMPTVYEMDDYRFALAQCRDLPAEERFSEDPVDALRENLTSLLGEFRETAFELIDSGEEVYGERFARALGDVAADFTRDHADYAIAHDYEAFRLHHEASQDPDRLVDLQHYYERRFLPQPLERDWLRRHDPALEIVTHGRNERIAEYAVYHAADVPEVHLIVGAAHQPGVAYYLAEYGRERPIPETIDLY